MHDDDAPLLTRRETAAAIGFAAVVTAGAAVMLPPGAMVASGILALLMALITLTDLRHFLIPDALSLPAIPLGVVVNMMLFHGDDWAAGLAESGLGMLLGAGAFYLLRWGYFRLRGIEGLGLGDVKLAAVAGAWLGPELLAPVCLAAALGGIAAVLLMRLLGRRMKATDHLPFGCFIAPAILLFWLIRCYQALPFG